MVVVPISSHHDRSGFDCGEEALNIFLSIQARRQTQERTGNTFVGLESEESRKIQGFYTLSSGSVAFEVFPSNLPRYPIPVAHLGRLAVDKQFQGKGIGEYLLMDALYRVRRVAQDMAVYAVEVIAKHDQAKTFYLKYGFQELLDNTLQLYLPMKTIMKLP